MTTAAEPSAEQIGHRLAAARERIARAGGTGVRVVAVTKTWSASVVSAAVAAGCDAIGENYAQEVVARFAGRPARPLVFIGQLQTNKVRAIAPLVDEVHSVDRVSLVDELARRCPGLAVLIQVVTDAQAGKGGCPLPDAPRLVDAARRSGLDVRGLMTVAPTDAAAAAIAKAFADVRRCADDLQLAECSMGMSDDFEIAVGEGATQVRLGSVLFGSRPVPPTTRVAR